MTKEGKQELLRRVKGLLAEAYGDRLQGVILYGSEARGEAEEDSDLDFLVLLQGPVDYGKELLIIIKTLYGLQLEVLRPLDALPVDVNAYNAQDRPLYENARREGILA